MTKTTDQKADPTMICVPALNRRDLLRATSALIVAFASGATQAQQRDTPHLKPGKSLKTDEVDGFIALAPDGSATIYCGKVDLEQACVLLFRKWLPKSLASRLKRSP